MCDLSKSAKGLKLVFNRTSAPQSELSALAWTCTGAITKINVLAALN